MWRPHHTQTWAAAEIDCTSRTDHIPTALQISLPLTERAPVRRGRPRSNQPLLLEQAAEATLEGKRFTITPDAWHANVHDHAWELTSKLAEWNGRGILPTAVKRKNHLSEATWQCVQAKKHSWKELKRLRLLRRMDQLRACFGVWSRHLTADEAHKGMWQQGHLDRAFLCQARLLQRLSKMVTYKAREDDKVFYQSLADAAGTADGLNNSKQLWQLIKPTLPRTIHSWRTNTACQQPAQTAFRDHFAALEAGVETTPEALMKQCVISQRQRADDAPLQFGLHQLPSRRELETLCRKSPLGKAPGMDGVTPASIRNGNTMFSEDMTILCLKAWTQATEPWIWKGGEILPIYKGKGPVGAANSYRGITLLAGLGKASPASSSATSSNGPTGRFPDTANGLWYELPEIASQNRQRSRGP